MRLLSALLLLIPFCSNGQSVQFSFGDTVYVEPGATVNLALNIQPFSNGIAFQGNMTWDSMCLRYRDTLPGASIASVYSGSTDAGSLFFAWAAAAGVNLPDSNQVLLLQFQAGLQSPKTTEIVLNTPLFYQIVGLDIVEQPATPQKLVIVIRQCAVSLDLGPDRQVCANQSVQIEPLCTNCATFKWSDGVGTPVRTLAAPGWYAATATAAQQCLSRDSILLTALPSPVFSLPDSLRFCAQTNATLSPQTTQTNDTYRWSTGQQTKDITVSAPGTYILQVTNTDLCSSQDTVHLVESGPTRVVLSAAQPNCRQTLGRIAVTQVIGGTGPYLYALSGQTFRSDPVFADLPPGTYPVVVQDADGCERRDTATLQPPLLPTIALDPISGVLNVGDSIQLHAVLPAGYPIGLLQKIIWQPTETLGFQVNSLEARLMPFANPQRDTWYTVTVTSKDACSASDSVLVRVRDARDLQVYVPNVFAPDAKGDNARFTVFSDDPRLVQIEYLRVYDRWGALVFEKRDFQANTARQGWDGNSSAGRQLENGLYVYDIEFKLVEGDPVFKSGEVMLLR